MKRQPKQEQRSTDDADASVRVTDRCWCGSGRRFEDCHLNRHGEKPLPDRAIVAKAAKYFERRECLHPQASRQTCGTVIQAHTVARSALLGRIVDPKNKVSTFFGADRSANRLFRPIDVGWKEASTFRGFCDKHDGPLFAPLEQQPFKATPEQCFLLAYRAVCHELYQKRSSWNSRNDIKSLIDRGLSPAEQLQIQQLLGIQSAGIHAGMSDAIDTKFQMDQALNSASFSTWRCVVLCFEGETSVVSAGAPTPNVDLDGNSIQVLHDRASHVQPLAFGMAPLDSGFVVVFAWRATDAAPAKFMDSLLSRPHDDVPHIVAQVMFAYVENTYFSRSWWEQRRMFVQKHIEQLAYEYNPYYKHPSYLLKHVVPWTLRSIEWVIT